MEAKQEGSSFFKRLQNKLKNLKTKLEKIEAKEKRPAAELSLEEQSMLRGKPQVLKLIQEYEHLVETCPIRDFVPTAVPEVRVETRVVDSVPEVARLWLTLHYVAQNGVKEEYLRQGLPLQDLEEVLQARKLALGQQEQPVKEVLTQALQLLAQFRQPRTAEEERRRDALTKVSEWALAQHIPAPRELSVATLQEVQQIVKETELVAEAVIEPQAQPSEPTQAAAPLPEAEQLNIEEEKGQPVSRWADEEEEEQPVAKENKEQQQTGNPEDDEFVEVKGRARKRKEAAPVPEARESRGGPQRRGRRGDRRPRGWRGQPNPQ